MENFVTDLIKLLLQARSYLAAFAVIAAIVYILRLFGQAEIFTLQEAAWLYLIGGFCALVLFFGAIEGPLINFRSRRAQKKLAAQRSPRGLRNVQVASSLHRLCLEFMKERTGQEFYETGYHRTLHELADLGLLDYVDPGTMHAGTTVFRVPDAIWVQIGAAGWRHSGLELPDTPPWRPANPRI
jgi:hypothetical protein